MENLVNVSDWYKDLSCDDTIVLLDEKITNIRMDFIAAGFYMKRVRDEEYYKTLGYETMWEFAEDRYGIQRSTASRWMAMNDKYSKDGNSPILLEEYKEFNKSQLQEMLYLTDEQLQEVSPDMTVKEIREVRKPEKEKITPIERGCITRMNPNKTCACCGNNGTVECCAQCTEDCNIRCGWLPEEKEEVNEPTSKCATSHTEEDGCPPGQGSCPRENWGYTPEEQEAGKKECKKCWNSYKQLQKIISPDAIIQEDKSEEVQIPGQMHITEFPEYMKTEIQAEADYDEQNGPEEVIDVSYEEVEELECADEPVLSERSELEIARELLEKEKRLLNDFLKEFDRNDIRCRKYEIKVAALALFVCNLEEQENPIFAIEQPELPALRNNDQRKAFLDSYKEWPVWFVVPEASETYYRYNFDDGSSIVICEYRFYSEWRKKYYNEDPNAVGTREYLLTPGYHYLEDCKANTTFLVEHLKKMQKKEK